MDNFEKFMHPPVSAEKEIKVSERLGKVKIKGMSTEKIQEIISLSEKLGESEMQLQNRLIAECITYPNLRDTKLCDYYKVYEPQELISKIFDDVSEYMILSNAVTKILGIKTPEQMREEVKNF